ncbi:MAG: sigma-70 family RNA polymerase sigma factor [Candidatus Kapaibacterium sp.]|jgi:RNA polymerase sigma-70 factor (ECF subfamily)
MMHETYKEKHDLRKPETPSEKTSTLPTSVPKGFEDLIVEHLPRLYSVALNLTKHNAMDAEDIVQEAMLRAFRNRASVEAADHPYAYLRTALVNTFLTKVRNDRNWNTREELTEAEDVGQEEIPSVLIENINSNLWDDEIINALDRLPDIFRSVLVLSDIEEMTREEICESLSLSKGTVSSRIFRARRLLARELEAYAQKRGFGSHKN